VGAQTIRPVIRRRRKRRLERMKALIKTRKAEAAGKKKAAARG
jgi:hypothetical protein